MAAQLHGRQYKASSDKGAAHTTTCRGAAYLAGVLARLAVLCAQLVRVCPPTPIPCKANKLKNQQPRTCVDLNSGQLHGPRQLQHQAEQHEQQDHTAPQTACGASITRHRDE